MTPDFDPQIVFLSHSNPFKSIGGSEQVLLKYISHFANRSSVYLIYPVSSFKSRFFKQKNLMIVETPVPKIPIPKTLLFAISVFLTLRKISTPKTLVHGQMMIKPICLASILIKKLLGVPIILSARGSDINIVASQSAIDRRIVSWAASIVDRNHVVTKDLGRRLLVLSPAAKVTHISNGIDLPVSTEEFPLREPVDSANPLRCIFVGRLDKIKNLPVLFQAFAILVKKEPRWILEIVGDGPEKENLSLWAEKAVFRRRVKILGRLPHDKTLRRIQQSHVLVLPSKMEGFPNVLLEAFAMKTPVVTSNVAGLHEIVRNGVNGYLTPVDDPAAIASAILKIGSIARTWEVMSQNCWALVKSYSWKEILNRLSYLYKEILAPK
ncbi:MAG: glycosyltransferase family 4 protein [Candidatus Heimdallarchaeota archaeon]